METADDLPAEQRASYTVIIDGILADVDLNTITPRVILASLQDAVDYDITPQKRAIKNLINLRFDKAHDELETRVATAVKSIETDHGLDIDGKQEAEPDMETEKLQAPPHTNGYTSVKAEPIKSPGKPTKVSTSSSGSELDGKVDKTIAAKRRAGIDDSRVPSVNGSASSPPPAKKRKKTLDMEDADAALAARLQAEENARSRPTRGGSGRKAAPPSKKKAGSKKKSKDKISAEDDSDVETSHSERKVNRNTGFHKLLTLSPALSALFDGEMQLSRPQATSRLWQYIKANGLQDPSDRRTIICDAPMKAVFKSDRISMFTMIKVMSTNLYNEGE